MKDKRIAIVQWVNHLWNNIFINLPLSLLLCEISKALHLAQPGLTADRQAGWEDKIKVNFENFRIRYRSLSLLEGCFMKWKPYNFLVQNDTSIQTVCQKFYANHLKDVQVMATINLQGNSLSQIHFSVFYRLKIVWQVGHALEKCWYKFGWNPLRNEWVIRQTNECTKREFEKILPGFNTSSHNPMKKCAMKMKEKTMHALL